MLYQLVFVIFHLTIATCQLYAGDHCTQDGVTGTCVSLIKCQSAEDDIRNGKKPTICGFDGAEPVVCCVGLFPSSSVTTSPLAKNQSILECEPIPVHLTSIKTGQKAWDKCIEYQEQLIFPCKKTPGVTGKLVRSSQCVHAVEQLVLELPVYKGQYPHMVLLGYGEDSATAQWLCSGTLISDRFILTAAHCVTTTAGDRVSFAVLGAFQRSDALDSSKVYKIQRAIRHPDFKPPSKYNDIALLETEKQMKLSEYAVPACLDVGREPSYDRAVATGWDTMARDSNDLQRVSLVKVSEAECASTFPVTRLLNKGVNSTTQTCYGPARCQGDSGGPLQVKNSHQYCMYTVVGVMSFGNWCYRDMPELYTRVDAYVPWIESIVWP